MQTKAHAHIDRKMDANKSGLYFENDGPQVFRLIYHRYAVYTDYWYTHSIEAQRQSEGMYFFFISEKKNQFQTLQNGWQFDFENLQ